jgi:hypothetical protein
MQRRAIRTETKDPAAGRRWSAHWMGAPRERLGRTNRKRDATLVENCLGTIGDRAIDDLGVQVVPRTGGRRVVAVAGNCVDRHIERGCCPGDHLRQGFELRRGRGLRVVGTLDHDEEMATGVVVCCCIPDRPVRSPFEDSAIAPDNEVVGNVRPSERLVPALPDAVERWPGCGGGVIAVMDRDPFDLVRGSCLMPAWLPSPPATQHRSCTGGEELRLP